MSGLEAIPGAGFVCPFCPLHCDDRELSQRVHDHPATGGRRGSSLPGSGKSLGDLCPLAAERLEAVAAGAVSPQHERPAAEVRGEYVTVDQAVEAGRALVMQARSIRISGDVIDWQTARAVCSFAEATGAEIACGMSPDANERTVADALAFRDVFSREGMFSLTLGEAASERAAAVILGDTDAAWPRLLSRLARAGTLYPWTDASRLADRLAALRRSLIADDPASVSADADLRRTYELCRTWDYVAFVTAPGAIDVEQARPFFSTMVGLLRDLNRDRRAAVLRFDPSLTLRSVVAARGLRVSGGSVSTCPPELEIILRPWPTRQATPTAVGEGAAKRIVIGRASDSPDLAIPAAVPGIDAAGTVLRGDGSVALPLRPILSPTHPTPSEVLLKLLSRPLRGV